MRQHFDPQSLTWGFFYARFFHVMPTERKNMQVTIPESQLINKVEYMGNTLTVEFARGGTYQYDNVPAVVVAGLTLSDSAGSFFTKFIRNKFPYHKIAE